MKDKRKKCEYPMSRFYNYEDEIEDGVRLNTPLDCKACFADGSQFDDCENEPYCLISGE